MDPTDSRPGAGSHLPSGPVPSNPGSGVYPPVPAQAPKNGWSGFLVGTGLGATITGLLNPDSLPTTPAKAVAWADAIREAGAPGAILVLLLVIYYLVAVFIPRREAVWENRSEQFLAYKDTVRDRLLQTVEASTEANVRLDSTLAQVLEQLKAKSGRGGRSDGTA